jgi:hypothetical protein
MDLFERADFQGFMDHFTLAVENKMPGAFTLGIC